MIAALLFSAVMLADPAGSGAAIPASAPESHPAAAPAAAAPKGAAADPDRICRLEAVLGSKITKKVCYNRKQMAQRTFDDKQNLDLLQSQTYMKSHE